MAALLQVVTICANFLVIIFIFYYFFKFHGREKELEKKEGKIDTDYHQIVDNALTKERKILEDATTEADLIIAGAQYISLDSKKAVDQSLQKMVIDIHKESLDTAHDFINNYQDSLKQLTNQSLSDLQNTANELKTEMQKQIKEFNETLLPGLKKSLDEYKQMRLDQTEQIVTQVVQKVSQEVLNKSISFEDHQNLLIESLEKAKKEGIFTQL